MDAVGCDAFGDYLDYLEVHPDEFEQLFDTLLINVTEFFRDPPAWEHLARRSAAGLLAAKPADEPIRVWSAGCATGEEAYTIAMLLAEALGEDELPRAGEDLRDRHRRGRAQPCPPGVYTPKEVEARAAGAAERYFERATRARVPQGPAAHGHLRP